jgi:hypothetical protein
MRDQNIFEKCFVCGVIPQNGFQHKQVNLPVCAECVGSEREKIAVEQLLEGLAEDFYCGCI